MAGQLYYLVELGKERGSGWLHLEISKYEAMMRKRDLIIWVIKVFLITFSHLYRCDSLSVGTA